MKEHYAMVRSVRNALVMAAALTFAMALIAPRTVRGLPSFSREYSVPCAKCHSAYSRLNAEGVRFLQNGYRMRDGSVAQPEARVVPLSVVGDMDRAVAARDSSHASLPGDRDTEQQIRHGTLGLHAAGVISNRVTYHVEAHLPSDDGVLLGSSAYAQLDDIARHGALNFKAGDFLVEAPYLSRSRPVRLVGYLTPVSFAARGLELNGAASAWSYGLGLVDSGRNPRDLELKRQWFGRLEDSYAWVSRELGGQQVTARMLFDRQDSPLPTLSWVQHLQAEASARFDVGPLELVPAYALDRYDDRPAAGIHQRRQSALLEARVPIGEQLRWLVTTRAELAHTTATARSREADEHLEAVELGYDVMTNAELALEWAHSGDNIAGPNVDQLNLYVRFGY
jgi:hypothetical protein